MHLLTILNHIEWAKGKEKIDIIESVKDLGEDTLNSLKCIVKYAYMQGLSYHITDVEEIKAQDNISLFDIVESFSHLERKTLQDGIDFLIYMNAKGSANSGDREEANDLYNSMPEDDGEVFKRVLTRDLKCGASIKTFRKVFGKDFCPDFPKSLCSTFDEQKILKNIKFPAASQLKSDGARCQFFPKVSGSDYICGLYTRNGSLIKVLSKLRDECTKLINDYKDHINVGEDKILDGELVVVDEVGEILPREIGNGIINKCIKGTAKLHEINRVRFVVWDAIPVNEFLGEVVASRPYKHRYVDLIHIIRTNDLISVVEDKVVHSIEEAKAHYHEMVNRGEEGTILKDLDGVWGNKRLSNQFKFKEEHDVDAVIVGWYAGKKGSKYEMHIGGLVAETRCGKVQFNVGSGLTDQMRKMDGDQLIGKIVECKYNYRTSVDKDVQTLFLPRVLELRFDKTGRDEANSLDELIKQEEASRTLKC